MWYHNEYPAICAALLINRVVLSVLFLIRFMVWESGRPWTTSSLCSTQQNWSEAAVVDVLLSRSMEFYDNASRLQFQIPLQTDIASISQTWSSIWAITQRVQIQLWYCFYQFFVVFVLPNVVTKTNNLHCLEGKWSCLGSCFCRRYALEVLQDLSHSCLGFGKCVDRVQLSPPDTNSIYASHSTSTQFYA